MTVLDISALPAEKNLDRPITQKRHGVSYSSMTKRELHALYESHMKTWGMQSFLDMQNQRLTGAYECCAECKCSISGETDTYQKGYLCLIEAEQAIVNDTCALVRWPEISDEVLGWMEEHYDLQECDIEDLRVLA